MLQLRRKPARRRPAFTLMYHDVETDKANPIHGIGVSPANFEQQMELLYRTGFRGVSTSEMVRAYRRADSNRMVGITFDDGYRSVLEYALPVLRHYGFTATVFAISGYVGGENAWDMPGTLRRHLDADELSRLAAAGMEIGSHSVTHPKMSRLDRLELTREAVDSRVALEALVERPVRGFCYPYGDISADAIDVVRHAGYDYACAVKPGNFVDRFALPRRYVGNRDGTLRLFAKALVHASLTRRISVLS